MTEASEPLSLADRRETDAFYMRYCWAINEGDAAGWADCYVADGAFVPAFGPVQGRFRPTIHSAGCQTLC
jgi:hypothetical protein